MEEKMMRISMAAFTLYCTFCLAGCTDSSVVLVKDGKAQAVIRVPERVMKEDLKPLPRTNPDREAEIQRQRLRESVRDLALYLEKMSGAKIEIVTNLTEKEEQKAVILIGEYAAEKSGPPARTYPYKQGFRIVVSDKDGTVGLSGESDLAVSYAIYEILDRLGCRWYIPGPMGEVIPKQADIKIPVMDVSLTPGTIYRGIWYADEAYRRRNRHGGLRLAAGHALEFYITKEDREKHPEWCATVDGKPGSRRLKWSNRELADAIADRIIERNKSNPQMSFSLSPDDGLGYDNSPEDRALDAGDIDTTHGEVSLTDRLMVISNRIADRVTKKYPDMLLGILAYSLYTRPPVREIPHPNIVPEIAPITYSRAHPMNDDNVPGNKELRYLVEGWASKVKMTGYYFYGWFLAEPVAPNPMFTKWGNDIPYVLQKGKCMFWQPETTTNFETSMHALYMGCRLAWDPSLKPEDVYREINTRFYENAAEEMTEYWNFIDSVWIKTNEYSGCGFGHLRRWTKENMKKARELMDAAVSAAATPEERFRVGLANDSLSLFEEFMKLRYDLAEGRFANLDIDAAAWRKRIVSLGEKYKNEFAFTKVGWTPHTMGGGYFASFYQKTYDDAARIARDFTLLSEKTIRNFRYKADPEKKGEALNYAAQNYDDSAWKTTDVAAETWSTLGYHDYFGTMWYRTNIHIPEVPQGRKVYLWIGATDGSVRVFVNGKHIPYLQTVTQPDRIVKTETKPEAVGYCRPFSFEITSAVRPGEENTIALTCTRTSFNELGTGGLIAPVMVYREKD